MLLSKFLKQEKNPSFLFLKSSYLSRLLPNFLTLPLMANLSDLPAASQGPHPPSTNPQPTTADSPNSLDVLFDIGKVDSGEPSQS